MKKRDLLGLFILEFFLFMAIEVSATGWQSDSSLYRKQINITDIQKNVTNYVLKLNINLTDEYLSGELNDTCSDIIMKNESGYDLSFYLQECNITGGNSTFWIKIPRLINNTNSSIYMYYGNLSQQISSLPYETFPFFDDFEGRNFTSIFGIIDGYPTIKYSSNPVLSKGSAGTWDAYGVRDPTMLVNESGQLVVENGNITMYFNGRNASGGVTAIGRAFSSDGGVTWTKDTNNPVFSSNSTQWENQYSDLASVMKKQDGTYLLYYVGDAGLGVGVATSNNGLNWTPSSTPILVPDNFTGATSLVLPNVAILSNGTYVMYFEGLTSSYFRLFMATSSDGLNWTPANNGNTVYNAEQTGTYRDWDRGSQANPKFIEYSPNKYLIYYNAYSSTGLTLYDVGIIYSTDLYNWTQYEGNPIIIKGVDGTWDDTRLEGGYIAKDDIGANSMRLWYMGLPTTDSFSNAGIGLVNITQNYGLVYIKEWQETSTYGVFNISSNSYTGNYSLNITDQSSSNQYNVVRALPPLSSGKGEVEFYAMVPQTTHEVVIDLYGTGAATGPYVRFGNDSQISFYNGTWNVIMPYTAEIWYKMDFVVNIDTDKFNLSINDTLVLTNGDFYLPLTDLSYFKIIGKSTTNGSFLLDNIKYRVLPDSEPNFLLGSEETETIPPEVTLASPSDSYSETSSSATIKFQFNVSDVLSDIAYCAIFLNGTEYANTSAINETNTNNISISSIGTGSYSWFVFCNDTLGNGVNSSSRSFIINVPTTTIEKDTASSGGGIPTCYITELNLQEGYSKQLEKLWKLDFKSNNETHQLRLDNININNKTATITILSEPQTKTLLVGEEWKVNLNNDNYYDLLVRLENITYIRANVFIHKINESVSYEDDKEVGDRRVIDYADKLEREYDYWLYSLGGILVLIVVILILFFVSKKGKRKKIYVWWTHICFRFENLLGGLDSPSL